MTLEDIEKCIVALDSVEHYFMPEDFSVITHSRFECVSLCMRKLYSMLLQKLCMEYMDEVANNCNFANPVKNLDDAKAEIQQYGQFIGNTIDSLLQTMGWKVHSYSVNLFDTDMMEELECEDDGTARALFYDDLCSDGMDRGLVCELEKLLVYEELYSCKYDGDSDVEIKFYTNPNISRILRMEEYVPSDVGQEIKKLASSFKRINMCGLLSNNVFWHDGELYFVVVFMNIFLPESNMVIDIYEYYSDPTIPFIAAKIFELEKMYQT